MKHLLSLILITAFFVGCSIKQQEVEMKLPPKENIGTPVKPTEDGKEENINPFEEVDIIENEMPNIDNSRAMKLAFIYPSKIVSKYAKSSMNTVLGYFDYKNINYEIKVFDTISEDQESINKAFISAKKEGFTNVIALFTPRVMDLLHTIDTNDLKVYLPLTNKNNIELSNDNFIYGGMSYADQIRKLLEYSNPNNMMFYQSSFLGDKLKSLYESLAPKIKAVKEIKKKRNYFKGIVKDYRIKNSTLFLNTPIVKTSIVLSQLRA